MQAFLSPERQASLRKALGSTNHILSQKAIDKFVSFADDLKEVDMQLFCHAQCVEHFERQNEPEQVAIGVLCMLTIMAEALSRGLKEDDFPVSLALIKKINDQRSKDENYPTIQ